MGIRFRQLEKVLQTVPSLRYLGRSTSLLFLGTRRDQPSTAVRWPGMGQVQQRHGSNCDSTTVGNLQFLQLRKVCELIVAKGQDMPYFGRAKFQSLAQDATWKDTSEKVHTHHLHLQAKSAGTTTRSSSRNLEGSFPDTAEFQEVYDESTIDCGSFMVIMEFFLCIAKEDCTLDT